MEHIWAEIRGDTLHTVVFLVSPRPVDALAAGCSVAVRMEADSPGLVCTGCELLAL
ncbi:hypothetical protein F0L17_25530 [Streptomyces sp. TRM43335]|uniref:Uncharacterized protein n=1 Tax=Streptomyces taklimakanensis TaxID=2569853 RepID=A0A6G2BKI0_9ACTN|nr:hypothetical protein [Streptomyces taklimakanensis]MTE22402.1 hypothetical protein [Streptomyces taklimakanensis]